MRYCLPGRIRTSEEEGLRLYDVHASSYTVIKHCCLLYKPVFQSNSSYHCGSAAVSFVTTMYYVFNLSKTNSSSENPQGKCDYDLYIPMSC